MSVTLQNLRDTRAAWKAAVAEHETATALYVKLYYALQDASKARDVAANKRDQLEIQLEQLGKNFAKDDGEDAIQNTLDLTEKKEAL